MIDSRIKDWQLVAYEWDPETGLASFRYEKPSASGVDVKTADRMQRRFHTPRRDRVA